MKIYTKTGDLGETALFGGQRVPKNHPRVEAYGAVDELNAALGFSRALGPTLTLAAILKKQQALLFELGADLATPDPQRRRTSGVTEADILAMEAHIDALETTLAPLKSFILPTGNPVAASLHQARTVCRRAERACVGLLATEPESPLCVRYLNRLGDLLFVMARAASPEGEEAWHPR